MKIEKLENIAEICSGLSTSRNKNSSETKASEVRLISVKDVDAESSQITQDIGDIFKVDDLKAIIKFVLTKNDIVITAKGTSIRASIYKSSASPIVPTSNLTIIKCNPSHILPDYLNVFLNMDKTVAEIQSKLSGSFIMSLSKKDLSQLEIIIPSIQEQEKIVRLVNEKDSFIKARKDEIKNMEILITNTVSNAVFKLGAV
jgi:restriction endonuclease S subunit